jgi:hypothetical protein
MAKIRTFFNNTLALAIVLALALGAVWFFRGRFQIDRPVAQEPPASPAPDQPVTPTPATEPKPTITPTQPAAGIPPDDLPDPTWTPAIVLPDATSPPTPTFVPTPTATPINPKEETILELKSLAGQLALSPDGQELAFVQSSQDLSRSELWKLNLPEQKSILLSESANFPKWSSDGQTILFERWYWGNCSGRLFRSLL